LKEELWLGRSPAKRSRDFIEVRLNVSQDHDTAARKQNKILTDIGSHGLRVLCMGQVSSGT
jgi:hypothetical protein